MTPSLHESPWPASPRLAADGSLSARWPSRAVACPFCSAVSLTFSEEIANSQVAVIAKLVEPPPRADGRRRRNSSLDVAKAKFEIIKILKGEKALGTNRKIETVYFGDSPVGSTFLIMGIDPPAINWGTPIAISERGASVRRQGDRAAQGRRRSAGLLPGLPGRQATRCWLATPTTNSPRRPMPACIGAQGPDEARQAGRVDQEPADSGQPPPACT